MIKIVAKEAKSFQAKVQGLIGKEKPSAILLKTRFGIHTFGVKFPIDILILDKNNKIVSLKENLRPNNIFLWNPLYKKVLELPTGTIKKNKIEVNKIIDLKLI